MPSGNCSLGSGFLPAVLLLPIGSVDGSALASTGNTYHAAPLHPGVTVRALRYVGLIVLVTLLMALCPTVASAFSPLSGTGVGAASAVAGTGNPFAPCTSNSTYEGTATSVECVAGTTFTTRQRLAATCLTGPRKPLRAVYRAG